MDLYFTAPKHLSCQVRFPQVALVSDVPLSSEQAPRAALRFIRFRGRKPEGLRHRDVEVGGGPRPWENSPEGDGRVAVEAVTY